MAALNYSKIVSPDSFIGRYMSLCANSETPHAYDFWTACWLLSSAVGRSVVVDRPGAPVYLNLFAILVAESGVTRKSTAVRRATGLYRQIKPEHVNLVESRITPELLEHQLSMSAIEGNKSQAVISIDELVKFLGREKYVSAMPTLLTDLYDCPSVRVGGGTFLRGQTVLKEVFVSFLSASTPSWLIRAVNPDVIEGGFTSRVVFVVAEHPKQLSPWPTAVNKELEEQLINDLKAIQHRAAGLHNIQISDGARSKFTNWYRSREIYRDPFRSSFQSREDGHILRCAALLCISDGTWEIQATHIVNAIRAITQTREDGAGIFEGTGTNGRVITGIDKIRDKLLAAGLNGLKQTEITKALQGKLEGAEVKAALDIMHELGLVQQFQNVQLGKGRPSTIWRATQHLASSKAIDLVMEHYRD